MSQPRPPANYRPQPPMPRHEPPAPHRGSGFLDVITTFFVIATVVVIGGTVLLLNNPDAAFNPLPNPTMPKVLVIPSPTITLTPTITVTPTITLTPTPFPTFTPTDMPEPSATWTITPTQVVVGAGGGNDGNTLEPGATVATPTRAPTKSPFEYITDSVYYRANQNELGCNWLSVGGDVSDINGQPVLDLPVEIIGDNFEEIVFTGSDPDFGPAGYQVQIDDRPSGGQYSVRLLGSTGLPVSDFIFVTMGATCDENVAFVNFVEAP